VPTMRHRSLLGVGADFSIRCHTGFPVWYLLGLS
jgi:hypothetical protein